ncbi:unnamed protein product [Meloidogyne enterolobii]|uniref:Uncharacterized protein n=1 Tax=Meloidogyne enterolobii TaxID=390850 RepID=A0ACB1A3L9_MELEN
MSVSSSDYEEMVLLPPSYHETPPSYVETSETSLMEQNNISNNLISYLPQVRTSLSSSNNDELLSSPPSYHEAPPVEAAETHLLEQNNTQDTNDTQENTNQQSNIPQRNCQTCKQRIITRIMILKCLCIFCILAWIFVIIVRFEDNRGRQCESVILKILNSTKCLERNITQNNSKSENILGKRQSTVKNFWKVDTYIFNLCITNE